MIFGLVAGAAWFALFGASHILVLRLLPGQHRPVMANRLLVATALGMTVSIVVLHMIGPGDTMVAWRQGGILMALLWGGLTFAGLFVLYMPFYYTVVASLSVRSLLLLSAQPHGYPLLELKRQFTSERLIVQRLETMVANGFLIHGQDGQYRLTAKARRLSLGFGSVKRFWRLGAGG